MTNEKPVIAMNENARKLIALYEESNAYGRENDMKLTVNSAGNIEYTMEVREMHLATPQAAHGGSIAGMMDAVLGVAALTLATNDLKAVSTVEFKIQYLRPIKLGDKLHGFGTVDHAGKRLIMTSGEIYCTNTNLLVAKGSGTMNAYPFKHAKLGNLDV